MKWLNCKEIKVLLIGFIAAVILRGATAKADFFFGEPANLGPTVNSNYPDGYPCISADGLELYFNSGRLPEYGETLWVATRSTTEENWGTPQYLGPEFNFANTLEYQPTISSDGLELYFATWPLVGLYMTKRLARDDPWEPPIKIELPLPSGYDEAASPSLPADGLEMYLILDMSGYSSFARNDLFVTRRETKDSPWGVPESLGPVVNNWTCQIDEYISRDGLLLIFCDSWAGSPRPGGFGGLDMWFIRRTSKDDEWTAPVNLGPSINTPSAERGGSISADGSMIYFFSGRPGGQGDLDIWQAPIIPLADFNGDGFIDTDDLLVMIDNWGTDNSSCDIGPMPWGDGVVDVQDLIVLSEHFFEDAPLPDELIAYLRLDEQEGDTASDSAGDNTGLLFGGPVWLPAEGKKGGSLQLDGTDDYIGIPYVLNPASGAFTVCAWINGGQAGQVIISQTDGIGYGSTWLGIDPTDGKLMTDLCFFELVSEKVITDGQWHHVVLVWNGEYRRSLYVDGQEVISDASDFNALSANGSMYIGANKNLDADTFFSGLIDDVRIYDVALTANEIASIAR